MRLSGSGTLISPSFDNSAVSRYDMLMPQRNTVFVVLKNASSATKLTLSYATNNHSGFTEDSSKTVEIVRSDEFTAYYFNLSYTACCDGRLTSFRLQAEGEGGDSLYGRRYVAANVKMKDDVELVIESCAVLWQSRHADDYAYAFEYGHDGTLSGVNWTHNMHINNLPLLQAYKVSNIKITGGGKAIAFITRGMNDDDLSLEEVKNITVCDNVLISNNPVGDNNFGLLLCCSDDASRYYFIEYTDIASKLQIREFSSKNPLGLCVGSASLK